MQKSLGKALVLAAAALALGASGALAALVGADSFDYVGTTLNDQNGGTNWGGAWTQNGTSPSVSLSDDDTSLSYPVPMPLTPGGDRILQSGAAQSYRLMGATTNMLEGGHTLYASALINQGSTPGNILFEFKDSVGNRRGGFGIDASQRFWVNCNSSATFGTATAGQTYLLVLKIVTGEGTGAGSVPDVAYLKVFGPGYATDPTAEPATWDAQTQTTTGAILDRVVMRIDAANVNAQVDELRIGTTWGDVVPEPATLGLLALGGLLLGPRRRLIG